MTHEQVTFSLVGLVLTALGIALAQWRDIAQRLDRLTERVYDDAAQRMVMQSRLAQVESEVRSINHDMAEYDARA